jgi:hypothetical protein
MYKIISNVSQFLHIKIHKNKIEIKKNKKIYNYFINS